MAKNREFVEDYGQDQAAVHDMEREEMERVQRDTPSYDITDDEEDKDEVETEDGFYDDSYDDYYDDYDPID